MVCLWICAGSVGIQIAALFAKRAVIFAERAAIQRTRRIFMAKGTAAAFYKTMHCGAAIKVRRTWWEKSSAHAAMFSSTAAVHLLHSFLRVPYIHVRNSCTYLLMCVCVCVCMWFHLPSAEDITSHIRLET